MTTTQALITVAIIAGITALTRVLPFALFPANRQTPQFIVYLGKVLPYAMIGMLIVYCLKDVHLTASPFGIPEALGIAVVSLLYLWKRNTLLAIGAGTVLYMLLVQVVFV